jgi:RNA recognition motif-containing protein
MAASILVGNLAFSISSDDLHALFAEHGDVTSAQIAHDRRSGLSGGFGCVEMSSAEAARNAISATHGRSIAGRRLRVNLACPLSS